MRDPNRLRESTVRYHAYPLQCGQSVTVGLDRHSSRCPSKGSSASPQLPRRNQSAPIYWQTQFGSFHYTRQGVKRTAARRSRIELFCLLCFSWSGFSSQNRELLLASRNGIGNRGQAKVSDIFARSLSLSLSSSQGVWQSVQPCGSSWQTLARDEWSDSPHCEPPWARKGVGLNILRILRESPESANATRAEDGLREVPRGVRGDDMESHGDPPLGGEVRSPDAAHPSTPSRGTC